MGVQELESEYYGSLKWSHLLKTVLHPLLKSWGSKLVLDHGSNLSPLLILGAILRLNVSIGMVTQTVLERLNMVVNEGWCN